MRLATAGLALGLAVVASADERPATSIEDPTGCALDRLHSALAAQDREGPVRVVHLGDSHVESDYWTGEIRRRMQEVFGVGGPGLFVPGRPWRAHRRADVRLGQTGAWDVVRMNRAEQDDGIVGLTGVALQSETAGATLFAESAADASGGAASLLELHYVKQPDGGRLSVWIDGERAAVLRTRSETTEVAYWEARVEEGAHRLEVRHAAGGPVRVLGVAMERASGLVWDALGTNGARLATLDRTHAPTFASELGRRDPSLVVFAFGTNEVDDAEVETEDIGTAAVATIRRVRESAPRASCLVVAPPDRALEEDDEWKTDPRVPLLVGAFRTAALRAGCAYWDAYAAMGGEGAVARWADERPPLAARDRVHLTVAGYRLLGESLAAALLESHARWVARRDARD